ncbi:hypothetical protein DPMN_014695 [Dreissena polymorpha]|uniref:Uncharacterized protein n=1 Tax=Dreissena polymorpha TaxID=45954 RepID=A0A9D4S4U1_DREPO|nr:hypothetical protein DPMN_014695 [Dreissena polymorpha]
MYDPVVTYLISPSSASVPVRRHLSKSLLMYDPVVPTSFPYQCQCLCQETS